MLRFLTMYPIKLADMCTYPKITMKIFHQSRHVFSKIWALAHGLIVTSIFFKELARIKRSVFDNWLA